MTYRTQESSPIKNAWAATPWWMMNIKAFDGLEIQPCAIVAYTSDGKEVMEPCEPEEASTWTVYGHYRPNGVMGGVDAFEDFKTEAEARKFHDTLIKVYPHLADHKVLQLLRKHDIVSDFRSAAKQATKPKIERHTL